MNMGSNCNVSVFRPGKSPMCLAHRGNFPGKIPIYLKVKGDKAYCYRP